MEKNPKLINLGPTSIPKAIVKTFNLICTDGSKSLIKWSKKTLFQNFQIQGFLSKYDFWDLEKVVQCKICTSGSYTANFH